METTLEKRIVNLEQQFLLAVLSNSEEALEKFFQEQSQFSSHIKALKASRTLDDKIALLTSYLAGSIENVANCALHIDAIFQDPQYHLNGLIREIPPSPHETLSHSPLTMPYHLLFSHHPSLVQTTLGQNKSLDAYAYRWLMQNLHDPYPTTMQTQVLGDLSGTEAAKVDIWFKEMRDAIGWTKLSRDFFASSPSATVAAARRVYLERDNNLPFGVVFAFTVVKASAETHFREYPAIQEKHFEDRDLSWTSPRKSGAQGHCIDIEGIFVPFQVDPSIPPDDFPYVSDDDESEEEDITPPPAVAGCKRRLTEDVLTLGDSNSVKPPKRHRIGPVTEGDLSNQECAPPRLSVSLLDCINTQATEPISVDISPTHIPSDLSLPPTSSSRSYDTSTSACRKRGQAEFHEDPSDDFVSLIDVPQRPIQRRKVIEGASPVPSRQVYSSPVGPGNHPPLEPSAPSELPSSPPFPHSIVAPVSVGADVSNPGIIDCDSIPSPQKDVAWISMPACITVSNSDFLGSNPQLPDVPGLESHITAGSSSSYSLGNSPSFGELSCLSSSPTSSSSSASLYSETPSTSQVFDWSNFTELIDPDFLTQSQSSSQTSPNSQENSLLTPLLLSCGINQPDISNDIVSINDLPRPIQRRKVSESDSPGPSDPVCSSPVVLGNHPSLDPLPLSQDPSTHPSLHPVIDPVSTGNDGPGNSNIIIDRNSISSPPGDAMWISMPAFIDVPHSDFLESNARLPHVPNLEDYFTAGSNSSCSLYDWPLLGELGFLSSSPISSSSLYSETPTSQVVDSSSLTEIIDPVFPTPSQSSSQTSLSTPPSTLPNSQEAPLLTPLLLSCGIDRLSWLLDPSTPPSVALPMQPDAFAEDIHLWPLYGVS